MTRCTISTKYIYIYNIFSIHVTWSPKKLETKRFFFLIYSSIKIRNVFRVLHNSVKVPNIIIGTRMRINEFAYNDLPNFCQDRKEIELEKRTEEGVDHILQVKHEFLRSRANHYGFYAAGTIVCWGILS